MFPLSPFLRPVFAILTVGLIASCSDLGTPDYSDQEGVVEPVEPFVPYPPDPFEPGDQRLYVGYFYEGDSSHEILINTVTTDYFVFAIDPERPIATRSFTENTSSDRLEGIVSYEITLNGSSFWGCGIIWDEPIDLSDWTTMFVGFKSSDPSFGNFALTLLSGEGDEPASVELNPGDYGYVNDGEWHFLQIPLQDAIDRGWDPFAVRSPFIVGGPGGTEGDVLLIDNLYFTKD